MKAKRLLEIIHKFGSENADYINDVIEVNTIAGWKPLHLSEDQYGTVSWFLSFAVGEYLDFEVGNMRETGTPDLETLLDGKIVEIDGVKYQLEKTGDDCL